MTAIDQPPESFTAAQAAQKFKGPDVAKRVMFTAAQAAQKMKQGIERALRPFTAAQAAQKLWR